MQKYTESKNPKFVRAKDKRIMLLSKCSVCNSQKSKFLNEQEARAILGNLGIRTPLGKIPFLGPLLFQRYKINEIINKFFLTGDKFMPEMHLKQPRSTYSACGPFTKKKNE